MGILNKIEELRKKPDSVKERIAVATAVGITVLLFLFWIFDFTITGGGTVDPNASTTAPSPLDIIGNNVSDLIDQAKAQFKTE